MWYNEGCWKLFLKRYTEHFTITSRSDEDEKAWLTLGVFYFSSILYFKFYNATISRLPCGSMFSLVFFCNMMPTRLKNTNLHKIAHIQTMVHIGRKKRYARTSTCPPEKCTGKEGKTLVYSRYPTSCGLCCVPKRFFRSIRQRKVSIIPLYVREYSN